MSLVQPNKHYTYSDYVNWGEEDRYELINGTPYMMSPAPSLAHQSIIGELHLQLANFLKGKPCKVFMAPCDVRLNAHDRDDSVVQPDLLVVCDMSKLDGKACVGAPDMVVEVLSPSSVRHDKLTKYNLYQQAGIREYWIVETESKMVQVCILKNKEYVVKAYDHTDVVPVHVLEGCHIDLSEVFAE
jgi:Uma2 family endonuclease